MGSGHTLSEIEVVARQKMQAGPVTCRDVAQTLSERFKTEVSPGLALQIITRLRKQGLIKRIPRKGKGGRAMFSAT